MGRLLCAYKADEKKKLVVLSNTNSQLKNTKGLLTYDPSPALLEHDNKYAMAIMLHGIFLR